MIKKIELKNFRRFNLLQLNTNYNLIIISGNNATGKTTILEAIYFIGTSKSHRTNISEALIKEEKDYSRIFITDELQTYKTVISKEGKSNYINEVEIKKISDFIGKIKPIMFSPLDLCLITGTKSDRRNFLDLQISLYDREYLYHLTMYKKILKKRNEILKTTIDRNNILLKTITLELIDEIKIIYNKRIEFIENLNNVCQTIYNSIDDSSKIFIKYEKTYDLINLEQNYLSKLNYDIITKTTNIGPHRDDFIIEIDNKLSSLYASQGQAKSIVVSIKLAIKEIIKEKTHVEPVLLLDDVFAELDSNHQNNLLKYLNNESQTFITTTSILNIPDEIIKNAFVINLDKNTEGVK